MLSLIKDIYKLTGRFFSAFFYGAVSIIALGFTWLIGLIFWFTLVSSTSSEVFGPSLEEVIIIAALDLQEPTPVVEPNIKVWEARTVVGDFKAKFYPVLKKSDNKINLIGIVTADGLNDVSNYNTAVQDIMTPRKQIFPLLHLFLKYNGPTVFFGILFFFVLTNYVIYSRLNRLVSAINAYKS